MQPMTIEAQRTRVIAPACLENKMPSMTAGPVAGKAQDGVCGARGKTAGLCGRTEKNPDDLAKVPAHSGDSEEPAGSAAGVGLGSAGIPRARQRAVCEKTLVFL